MTELTRYLADYLGQQIRAAVERASEETSSSASVGSLRLTFAAPPKAQLEKLFALLTADEDKLVITTGHGEIQVPVFLVDNSAKDPPGGVLAAQCTEDYLTTVRNGENAMFLALYEVGHAIKPTIATAATPVGIRDDISTLNIWLQEPLVENLVNACLEDIIGSGNQEPAKNAITHAIREAWEIDERYRDRRTVWAILTKLTDLRPVTDQPHEALSALLGLPACGEDELGSKTHLETLDRLADMLQAHGFRKGFEELVEIAGVDLKPHVKCLREHLEAQDIIEAGEFARSPFRYYCPINAAKPEIPDWWRRLDTDAWSRLLDAGTDNEPTGKLDVRLQDQLATTPRGMPLLTRDRVELEISIGEVENPVEITISRASGQKPLVECARVTNEPASSHVFSDPEPPDHDRFVRYKIEAEGYAPVTLKVIVLERYGPGIVASVRGAKKATPFKLNKKAKDSNNKTIQRYDCEIELSGMGAHSLDLFMSSHTTLGSEITGYEVNAEHDGIIQRSINANSVDHSTCLVESDEECHYEFFAELEGASDEIPYRIYFIAGEAEATGATSEFDRLVIENRASARQDQAKARVEPANCRATNLEEWMLEDPQSFRPLLLGPDYLDAWRKPQWAEHPTLSEIVLPVDPRPLYEDFQPPEEFISARGELIQQIIPVSDDGMTPSAGMLRLHDCMQSELFVATIGKLLDSYIDWLDKDFNTAVWSDVIGVLGAQSGVHALESAPYSILLTPLHPVRLAWQCRAQEVLQTAINKNTRCPAASMLNPAYFPDCMMLPCRTGGGQVTLKSFAAMASSSDYWSVLWSADAIKKLSGEKSDPVFGAELGITVDGLASGFTAQQVIRSLDEVSRLLAAKSTIRLSVESDTSGAGSCNAGIDEWCSTNFGPDHDYWTSGGPRSIAVVDHRESSLHPEQAVMASLTSRVNAAAQWFKGKNSGQVDKYDLSIIAHLGTMNHEFTVQGIRSAIDPTCLSRWRIRKQLPGNEVAFIAESRIGDVPTNVDHESLTGKLLRCVDAIESRCRDDFDSYVFAPNMSVLSTSVDSSAYTAVSSSNIDAACFFGPTDKAYLWDYELPSYARRSGENSGYFLLARETEGMLVAVRAALGLLGDHGHLEDDRISGLLEEISRRGMPTLKRLTAGGSMSFGEVGMLVALRLLQSDFEQQPVGPGLLPVSESDQTLNLVVPADPFKNHFEDLRMAIENKRGERPDLLVLSLNFVSGIPMHLKITPLEVKARGEIMGTKEREDALKQASNFAKFLLKAQTQSGETELWGIAWRSLVSTLLDYGFRVYGQLDQFMQREEWAAQHSASLRSLANQELEIEVDSRGRLLVVDKSNNSTVKDLDRDDFDESIVLSHEDAYTVLAQGGGPLVEATRGQVGHWGLKPAAAAVDIDKPRPEPGNGEQPTVVVPEPVVSEDQVSTPATDEPSTSTPTDQQMSKADEVSEPTAGPSVDEAICKNVIEDDVDASKTGIKFTVGNTILGFSSTDVSFYPGNTALNQLNVGIVGDLGTGKTQLIQALVYQLRARPETNRGHKPNLLIFDYKRDYTKKEFVEATGARVIKPFSIPLNLFDTGHSPQEGNAWLGRSKFFCDVLDKIYSGIGPAQRERIKGAVKSSYEDAARMGRKAPTIRDVFEAYKLANGNNIDAPYSIMSDLVDGEYFVSNASEVQSFSEFMNGIVVVDLAAVGQDDKTKNMLVVMFLNLFYEHMLCIEKKPFIGTDPQVRFVDTMLLVDEADNIMKYEFDVLKKILLQGREFGVGVLLASQYLSHFKAKHENYLEPLLTWFIHKVPNLSVKDLEGIGLSNVSGENVDTVKSLKCHECLFKTLGVDGKFIMGTPFYKIS